MEAAVDEQIINDIDTLRHEAIKVNGYALDIGSTLAKIVYFSESHDKPGKGSINVITFRNNDIEKLVEYIKQAQLRQSLVSCTGLGSYKYKDMFEKSLGITLQHHIDEFRCFSRGLTYMMNILPEDDAYHLCHNQSLPSTDQYPFMLVTIGTGVSIVKVEIDGQTTNVAGTNRGGGAFTGLGGLLLPGKSFDEIVGLAEHGDNRNVDMLITDAASKPIGGLPAEACVAYFGKAAAHINTEGTKFKDEDIALSLLRMIISDITALVHAYANQHNVSRIYMCGSFVTHRYVRERIRMALCFLTRGKYDPLFPKYGNYLGALGAWLLSLESDKNAQNEQQDVFWSQKPQKQ